MSRPLRFRAVRPVTREAVVLIFDLEGFSTFCAQPGAQMYVPALLNRVFDCLQLILEG